MRKFRGLVETSRATNPLRAPPIPETETDRPQGGNSRIRGLSAADLTRNYFVTDVPFDTYNTNRLEVQRGANSALFGIGSPGGIVNTSTIRANLYDNFGRLRIETDEHGTFRSSLRYNRVLVEDKLAIHIAGLSSKTGSMSRSRHF